MKNTSFFKTLTLFAAFALVSAVSVHAETWSYEFEKPAPFTSNGTESLDGISWTLDGDGGYWGWDGNTNKGQQFGSGSKPYTTLTLSTSDFEGTITSVVINAATAKDAVATMSVTVGGAAFGSEQDLAMESADYTFSGSAAGEIVISMTQTSSKALYIKSITVDYTPGEVAVERPVATPAAGFYTEAQNVTLTCATEGATIRYTLDGTEPTAASTEYTAPISISKTTTLKAIAIKGEDISSVLTADYALPVDVADIAALIANEAGSTYYRVTGALTVLYHGEGRIFVADAAGSRLLIYDRERNIETTYTNGQTLTGVIGQLTDDSQGKVLSPYLPMPEAGEGTAVAPVKKTPEAISEADMYAYVSISGVVAASAWDGSEAAIKVGESGALTLYNQFKLSDELVAGSAYDIEAIVSQYKGNLQLLPIKITESTGSAVRPVSVKGVEAYSADGVLYVSAAVGERIEVYSLLGSLLYNAPAADAVTAIEGLPQSVVIVRVGRAATKVVVR